MKNLIWLLLLPVLAYGSGGGGFGGSSTNPLTTKGDLFGYTTASARLPVGSDGQILSSDSTQSTGLKWVASGLSGGTNNALTKWTGSTSVGASGITDDGTTLSLIESSATNYTSFTYTDSNETTAFVGHGNGDVFKYIAATNYPTLYGSSGTAGSSELVFGIAGTKSTEASTPSQVIFRGGSTTSNNSQSKTLVANRRGRGTGAITKLNAFTVVGDADVAIAGTTTVSASTSVTGSGTLFTQDLGVGDWISVSSAASTYARITAITNDTSLTVDANLGDGSSQTINKKQALASWQNSGRTVVADIDPNGKLGMISTGSSPTSGTLTANGTTGVTVSTTAVTANSLIFLEIQVPGGTPGTPYIFSRSAGTSFTVKSLVGDTSTVGWFIIEPR